MAIPIHPTKTGSVFLRHFDLGIVESMGATRDLTDLSMPCYKVLVDGSSSDTGYVKIFFEKYNNLILRSSKNFLSNQGFVRKKRES